MNSMQTIWSKTKKILKFIWRHVFTLADISLSIKVLIFHTLIWKNAFISLAIAIIIDWVKQFIKLGRNFKTPSMMGSYDISKPLHIRQWWNPGVMGTGIYDLNRQNTRWDR